MLNCPSNILNGSPCNDVGLGEAGAVTFNKTARGGAQKAPGGSAQVNTQKTMVQKAGQTLQPKVGLEVNVALKNLADAKPLIEKYAKEKSLANKNNALSFINTAKSIFQNANAKVNRQIAAYNNVGDTRNATSWSSWWAEKVSTFNTELANVNKMLADAGQAPVAPPPVTVTQPTTQPTTQQPTTQQPSSVGDQVVGVLQQTQSTLQTGKEIKEQGSSIVDAFKDLFGKKEQPQQSTQWQMPAGTTFSPPSISTTPGQFVSPMDGAITQQQPVTEQKAPTVEPWMIGVGGLALVFLLTQKKR